MFLQIILLEMATVKNLSYEDRAHFFSITPCSIFLQRHPYLPSRPLIS